MLILIVIHSIHSYRCFFFLCCARLGGLQSPARISPLHQEKTRSAEVGKPFPRDQQTLQAVREQKLLEEYDLSNALRAYGQTRDCNLKSGGSGSVCAPANGTRRTPLKNPRRRSSSKKNQWKAALRSHSPSVRFMLSMLPPTVETGVMKIHITSFWVPNPGGLTLKCQVLCVLDVLCLLFNVSSAFMQLFDFIYFCMYLFLEKEISEIFF